MKPLKLPLWDFLDVVTFWLFDGASEDSQREMEILLTQPPANAIIQEDDPLWSADAEMAMFQNMME